MKKINTLLVLFVLVISACKKDQKIADEMTLFSRSNSKLSSSRPLHPGDPNLDANWDWTQSSWTAYFNNANGTIGTVSTLNPFLDASQKVFGKANPQKADMYPVNGWMLVSRDFGTATTANTYPFLILYNKYRGLLRVCILRTYDVLSSYQQITLNVDITGGSAPNGTRQTAITTAGVQEWMIADFDITQYQESINDYSTFNISMSEIAQSNVVLNGNIQLDGTAQPNVSSPSALGTINSINNFAISTGEGASKVLKIPEQDTEAWIAGGIGLFFNSALKLLTGFSGGGTSPTYNIKLKGPISLNGAITLTSPKTSFSVYLKPLTNTEAYRSLQPITWGVYKINPIVKREDRNDPTYIWVPDPRGFDYMEEYAGWYRSIILDPNFITLSGFTINPTIAGAVANIEFLTITEDWQYNGPVNSINYSSFLPKAQFEANTMSIGSRNSDTINLGIKITFNDGSIVYQVLPF